MRFLAHVPLAQELSAANKTALTKQLNRFVKENQKLVLETKVCCGS